MRVLGAKSVARLEHHDVCTWYMRAFRQRLIVSQEGNVSCLAITCKELNCSSSDCASSVTAFGRRTGKYKPELTTSARVA